MSRTIVGLALLAASCMPPQGPTSMVSSTGEQEPLRLETIQRHRLRETDPTCYAAEAGQTGTDAAPNRIEAVFYFGG